MPNARLVMTALPLSWVATPTGSAEPTRSGTLPEEWRGALRPASPGAPIDRTDGRSPARQGRPQQGTRAGLQEGGRERKASAASPPLQPGLHASGGSGFAAHLIAQSGVAAEDAPTSPNASLRGTEAYRRAGAAPPLYDEEPAFLRVSI